jgi:phage host-nuclease inhibitor protein Gam
MEISTMAEKAKIQSRKALESALQRMGKLTRRMVTLKANHDARIAAAKSAAEGQLAPLRDKIASLRDDIETYAQSHRDDLLRGAAGKTAHLVHGQIAWRARPVSIETTDPLAAIEWLESHGHTAALRVSVALNREWLAEHDEVARIVPGLVVIEGEESILIKPA